MNASKYVVWDFDNTLAIRPGLWGQCLADVVNRAYPQRQALRDAFRPHLVRGFPWHDPVASHCHIGTADEWWAALAPVLEQALQLGAALEPHQAAALTGRFREAYLDASAWKVFDDTVPALELLAQEGWQQIILSNHVPELPTLVAALGLKPYFVAIHSSGSTGFEKPHPRSYATVLESLVPPWDRVVMIGDNYSADFAGPRGAGMEAVLVRATHPQCDISFSGLIEAAQYLCRGR